MCRPQLLLCFLCAWTLSFSQNADNAVRPFEANKAYWQYKGKPVLLLGATIQDNLFQINHLESHLDSLQRAGGNYVRNTMSDRDPGNMRAFARNPQGRYDLGRWNEEYWNRFEDLLKLTSERNIIVQIEIWDRFDHSRNEWQSDPYNPKNNINYSYAESGLDSLYPMHPGANKQPFFYSVPALNNNSVLLRYQKAFVEKLLSVSIGYDNVLYCIDNETSGEEAWAVYWADFVRERAGRKTVYITQMWDPWDVKKEIHKRTLDHPERYSYIDISQNSQLPGYENWLNQQYIFDYIKGNPRPVNSTKIYGSDEGPWLDRGITTEHAVQTFFRNILGGFASSRFHRPPSGLGLSDRSVNAIRTVRKIEAYLNFRDLTPRMDLLSEWENNEAYAAAKEGESYVVYFTAGGSVNLDLRKHRKRFSLMWISVLTGEWGNAETLKGGEVVTLRPSNDKGSLAVLVLSK